MLKTHDLAIARGGVPLLEGLNFAVEAGQLQIVQGGNGSGKTTLLRTIAGLQPPWEGRVDCAAEDLAYAAHADGLKAHLTVQENIAFWAQVFGQANVSEALQAYEIDAFSERPAHMLSAGQKRRLGLARLIVTGRKLWIMDEPTVTLDRASVALFRAALERHLELGGAALVATHIDLSIKGEVLDVTGYKADPKRALSAFEEGFL